MSRPSTEATTILLLPVCRSFLMVNGHLYFRTPHLSRLSNRYLSIPSIQPHRLFNYTHTHQSSTICSACSPLLSSAVFIGFCCCPWEPPSSHRILHYPFKIHPLHLSSLLDPSSSFLCLTLRITHGDHVFQAACWTHPGGDD